MAAWFVLSSIGFYPQCPGRPDYTLGSPLFNQATLHLPEGETLVIDAKQNSATNVFVRGVQLNGKAVTAPTIEHSAIVKGGRLTFDMSAERGEETSA
jgi:putative alpha-1,2-mannosidase